MRTILENKQSIEIVATPDWDEKGKISIEGNFCKIKNKCVYARNQKVYIAEKFKKWDSLIPVNLELAKKMKKYEDKRSLDVIYKPSVS